MDLKLDDKGDVEELKEVMSIMATEIPKLLEAISKTMYSADNAAKLGEQTAEFYKKLKDAGMSEEQAFKLTEEFMTNFSVGSMIGKIIGGARQGSGESDEMRKQVNERIKKKMKEALDDDES